MKRAFLLIGVIAAAACGRGYEAAPDTQPPATANTSSGSCVEQYSPENLRKRDYAFDGTVRAIDPGAEDQPDRVTFDVREWLKGGMGDESVRKAYGFTAVTSAGGSPHAVGERLLVAGDDDFLWECGFTRPYHQAAAEEWKDALGA